MLRDHPFASPYVERSTAEIARAVDRAMARAVTPEWLLPRLSDALAAGDEDAITFYDRLAEDHRIPLPEPLADRLADFRSTRGGMMTRLTDCAVCAYDITRCANLPLFAACALPLEMTPIGDLNALRRSGEAYLSGQPIDRLEAALAMVGLGATGAAMATGGTSLTVKAGATTLRLAQRLGHLTPGLRGALTQGTDAARLAGSRTVTADLFRLSRNAGGVEALHLIRHVDDAGDAARLARLSDAAGPATRGVLEVLGKSRALRLTFRLADNVIAAFALLYSLAIQTGLWIMGRLGRAIIRALA